MAQQPVVLSTRRHEGRIAVTVRDRGTGIAAEDMAHIFDPFFTTRRAGTGLGLPIAKNIIDGLGGSLSVDSRPDAGTEIRIELPLTLVSGVSRALEDRRHERTHGAPSCSSTTRKRS